MHILVTGAAGFLGQRIIAALLARETLTGRSGHAEKITRITAFDVVPLEGVVDPRVHVVTGDIREPEKPASLIGPDTASVFHLAAIVSGQAEQEFDLGMHINFDATRALLDRIRAIGEPTRFVMTSSVAVFGGALPETVPDHQVWAPKSSYGTQKAMADLMLSDYSRRGYVDGRSLRMPTIVVRPGKPNKAASSFASSIIREPVNGVATVCPVAPESILWLMSPARAIENLIHGHELPPEELGAGRVINMPGLSISVGAMIDALRRVAGDTAAELITQQRDPAIERIVNSWPGNFSADYARALGFVYDTDFDSVIRTFMAGNSA